MSDHEHEPIISGDIIRCRTCGHILPYAEETISKVSSAIRARRILDMIAVNGKYKATGFSGKFIVYSKNRDGITEEITAEKLSEREFRVFKKVISE